MKLELLDLPQYIKNLNFEYAILFSGLEGKNFERLKAETQNEISKLELEIKDVKYPQQIKLKKQIQSLSKDINEYNSRIIDKIGRKHPSTEKIYMFLKNDVKLKNIFEIFETTFEEQYFFMCAPVFRDAIAFYSKENSLAGIIHICFECAWMKNENEKDFKVDYKIFSLLTKVLSELKQKSS